MARPVTHLKAVAEASELPSVEKCLAQALATIPVGQHFKLTPAGLVVVGEPSFQACADLGELLRTVDRAIQFLVGDWVNYVEAHYHERASQLIDVETGWQPETIRAYAWTAEKVAPARRMLDRGLSYKHHQLVAALNPRQQTKWLTKALGNGTGVWATSRLEAAIKAGADQALTRWWVLAGCADEQDQAMLLARLQLEGRNCKAVVKRGD